MENRNSVQFSADLSTDLGKAIFAAVSAVLAGQVGAIDVPAGKKVKEAKVVDLPVVGEKVAAPSIPTPPAAPSAPAKTKKAAPAPVAPSVPFEQLDEAGKREAILKVTTKHSKKGKTTELKSLYAAYGAQNVQGVPVEYLDHMKWAVDQYDTNGNNMPAVLATFGAQ